VEPNHKSLKATEPVHEHHHHTAFLFGTIAFLIAVVALGSGMLLVSKKTIDPQTDSLQLSPSISQQSIISPTTIPQENTKWNDVKIDELITFITPRGWTKNVETKSTIDAGIIELVSPDMAPSCCGPGEYPAVNIDIVVAFDGKTNTLEKQYKEVYDEIHAPNPGGAVSHDLTKTTIAGYQAISYYYDFEGHKHTYMMWNEDQRWEIRIYSASGTEEIKHSAEIQSMLSSIKLSASDLK
jgi:hypothetical protein